MDRIGPAGGSPTTMLPNGQQGYQDENLATGVEGTEIVALGMNAIQEELMSVLNAAGITPNINNWTQVLAAIQTLIGQAGNAYLNVYGYWYFTIQLVGLSTPLIVTGGSVTLAAGVSSLLQPLPVSFNNGYLGGLCTDGGAAAYQYGVAASPTPGDLNHIEVYCPISQLISGTIVTRSGAEGRFIAVGW